MRAIAIVGALTLLGAGVLVWRLASPAPDRAVRSGDDPVAAARTGADPAPAATATPEHADPAADGSPAGDPARHAPAASAGSPAPPGTAPAVDDRPMPAKWPFRNARSPAKAAAGDPSDQPPPVARELAFQALALVGVDPEAEATWLRAIQDPRTPAGDRSDLIEDLNEVGYRDNGRPTAKDLPLIEARLRLLERLAPVTTDPVNRAAIEEAYKDLLAMYERLGGAPRAGSGR